MSKFSCYWILEEDRIPPTYKVVNSILDFFNVDCDYLLGHKNINPVTFGERMNPG